MATEIFGIRTVSEQPKARIELLICGNIPNHDFTVEEVIDMLIIYKTHIKKSTPAKVKLKT